MKLDDLRRSDNVQDRRGMRIGRTGARIGIGTLVVLVAGYFLGVDPAMLMGLVGGTKGGTETAADSAQAPTGKPKDPEGDLAAAVLGSTEDTWTMIFKELGARPGYIVPTMILYSDAVQSGCGAASAASGPFYCPADQRLYLDLNFFKQLKTEFDAAGDFAEAYVIAHEVGHHVQAILGTTELVQKARSRSTEEIANLTQVKTELQADCYAGIWARRADDDQKFLEPGDIEEALNAAAAVGDDTIQRRVRGRVEPDTFTHGTAKQRATWFKRGFDGGTLNSCDTYSAAALD
jgi:predicted metalloprotease